jgi:hypothetical protein
LSTCNQLIRICRIPDVMSLADGLRHAAIQFRDGAMRSDKSNIPETSCYFVRLTEYLTRRKINV